MRVVILNTAVVQNFLVIQKLLSDLRCSAVFRVAKLLVGTRCRMTHEEVKEAKRYRDKEIMLVLANAGTVVRRMHLAKTT